MICCGATVPDIITYLQNRTNLKRKTIVSILIKSNTLNSFKKNPQAYMEDAAKTILSSMKSFIVDGIKYTKLGNEHFYAQELFKTEELYGYLEKNIVESEHSVFSHVIYDSEKKKSLQKNLKIMKMLRSFPNYLLGLRYLLHLAHIIQIGLL